VNKPAGGFSPRTAAFLVVSSTVGGGILGTAGFVVNDAGSHAGAILVWAVGGLIAACGALSLAEVSASLPRSGGEFVILTEAYGPLVGFLGGWVSLVFGFTAPIAATGSAAATYLLAPQGIAGSIAINAAATVAIAAFALAHATGRSRTERVQGLATSATILVLALFIVAGLWAGWPARAEIVRPPSGRVTFAGLFVGLILVSYAYTGWNGVSYVAGEVADPQRVLPRAIVIGTSIVIALYLGIVVVIALALPASGLIELAATDRPALERVGDLAAIALFGARGAAFIATAMGVVLLASLSAMMLTGPRVAFAMAREGRLPAIFGRLTSRGDTPAAATAVVAGAAIVMLWSGGFEAIAFAAGVGLALNSLLTVTAVFVLRRKHPDWPRPFRTPGYPVVPLVFLSLTAASLIVAFLDREKWVESLVGLGGVLCGVPAYWFATRRGSKHKN
jgi:basic amino acid/polyamine antiporter, APA family